MTSSPFLQQIATITQLAQDKRDASAEAALEFEDDFLTIYDTCQDHANYWQERSTKWIGYGNDPAFPDHPNHSAWCAWQKHQQDIRDFKDRHFNVPT